MKITVITGSPHKKGTSALLAEKFIEGAEESGHEIFRFDAAFEELHPCKACEHCHLKNDGCIYKDSMEKLNPHLINDDMIVFVTPLYYFGMTAQIKMVIDRFYANNAEIMANKKECILLATSGDGKDWTMEALVNHYKTIVEKYMGWENKEILLATGCVFREDIENTDYPEKAYELGKNI